MKQCEKCHTENNDEAVYCKNCGHMFEMGKTNQVLYYSATLIEINKHIQWSISIFLISFPFGLLPIIFNLFEQNYYWFNVIFPYTLRIFLFFTNIVSFILGIVYMFKYPTKQWTKFYLNSHLKNAKEKLTAFVFSQNTSKEIVNIRENSKGELQLKDKTLGAKGYFHLVSDKKGNVLLIGEKYNTQNLIRTVFGKDINFIEK